MYYKKKRRRSSWLNYVSLCLWSIRLRHPQSRTKSTWPARDLLNPLSFELNPYFCCSCSLQSRLLLHLLLSTNPINNQNMTWIVVSLLCAVTGECATNDVDDHEPQFLMWWIFKHGSLHPTLTLLRFLIHQLNTRNQGAIKTTHSNHIVTLKSASVNLWLLFYRHRYFLILWMANST